MTTSPDQQSYALPEVLSFYKELPFNFREDAVKQAEKIKNENSVKVYPPLDELLSPQTNVLEVGCGVGWLSCGISQHYASSVTGIDFNPVAISSAKELASLMDVPVSFEVHDLFKYFPKEPFDLVVSMGALHHTGNCHEAINHICNNMLKVGGHFIVGLYHTYGRHPFLQHFEDMKKNGSSEREMLARYAELHSSLKDEVHIESWFRDQVLHPHETQHSFKEIAELFENNNVAVTSTSINQFNEITSLSALHEDEKKYEEISIKYLENNVYFPGFFVVTGKKLK